MKLQPALILMLVHIVMALICVYFILSGRIFLRKEHIIPIIILPLVGPLLVFIIQFLNALDQQGRTPLDMEPLTLGDDILWRTLKSYHEKGNIVPLEEALLIDDMRTRRKFMLETLYEDPLKYLDILMLAKNNDDVETSHYATTTISHAQREFQVAIQGLAVAVENHPNNMALLDKYVETLGKYIESGLLEEHLLRNLRTVYKEILDKKLTKVANDKMTLIKKLRNSIELRDYVSAFKTSDLLKKYWSEDEQTWIESLRVCIEGKDQKKLRGTLEEIQRINIDWTKQGKEQIGAWMKAAIS